MAEICHFSVSRCYYFVTAVFLGLSILFLSQILFVLSCPVCGFDLNVWVICNNQLSLYDNLGNAADRLEYLQCGKFDSSWSKILMLFILNFW